MNSIDEVIASGREHGATKQDLFGCLYFYLSETLRKFASRIRSGNYTFHIYDKDCIDLAASIKLGQYEGLRAITFDRIELSNVIDDQYLGFDRSLRAWSPFLNSKNPYATIIAYSMNWVLEHPEARFPRDRSAISRMLTRNSMVSGIWGRGIVSIDSQVRSRNLP
jgi:hypothetical protein